MVIEVDGEGKQKAIHLYYQCVYENNCYNINCVHILNRCHGIFCIILFSEISNRNVPIKYPSGLEISMIFITALYH